MCLTEIIEFIFHSEFIGVIVGVIISAILLYRLGIIAYRKQKSIEECRIKYLDEGIEALRRELAEGHSTFMLNWSMALSLLKHVRDWKQVPFQVKPEDIIENFITFKPKTLGLNYLDKVHELIGDDIATKWSFSTFSDINLATFFFTLDLAVFVRKFLEVPEDSRINEAQFSKAYFEKLEKYRKKIRRHLILIDYLGDLCRHIRMEQISYEKLPKIKEHDVVKQIVKKMNDNFEVIEKEQKEKRI